MINYKLILFNGPPRSGKDTGVDHLVKQLDMGHIKLAGVLKDRTHALYGLKRATEHYDRCKDRPHDDFLGIKPRDAYINVAEKLFKEVHGQTIFPELLTIEVRKQSNPYIAVSDLGFQQELEYFVEHFGAQNILLVKVFRKDCNFDNDSRDYVDEFDERGNPRFPGLQTINIINDKLDKYQEQLSEAAAEFLLIPRVVESA